MNRAIFWEGAPWLAGFVAAGIVILGISCSLQKPADAGAPCAAPTPGIDACVLPNVARAVVRGDLSWATVCANAAHDCGTDKDTVASIWGAHVQAEVIEGFVPKMIPAPQTSVVGGE